MSDCMPVDSRRGSAAIISPAAQVATTGFQLNQCQALAEPDNKEPQVSLQAAVTSSRARKEKISSQTKKKTTPGKITKTSTKKTTKRKTFANKAAKQKYEEALEQIAKKYDGVCDTYDKALQLNKEAFEELDASSKEMKEATQLYRKKTAHLGEWCTEFEEASAQYRISFERLRGVKKGCIMKLDQFLEASKHFDTATTQLEEDEQDAEDALGQATGDENGLSAEVGGKVEMTYELGGLAFRPR